MLYLNSDLLMIFFATVNATIVHSILTLGSEKNNRQRESGHPVLRYFRSPFSVTFNIKFIHSSEWNPNNLVSLTVASKYSCVTMAFIKIEIGGNFIKMLYRGKSRISNRCISWSEDKKYWNRRSAALKALCLLPL